MSTGQIAGAAVGGAIGFMVGGPAGAFVGAGIGAGLGGALGGGQKGVKPNINTDPGQTSTYGAFITRTYGTIGQSGNIIWIEGNALKAVIKKAKSSGKGGSSTAATATVTYFATFAVGLCEGPIAGVRRIWVGTNLVYDAGSDDLESIIASNQALKNFKIYLGTDTQAPNSRIQADRGAANTSAYPGLAYIVVTDLALANYGNSIQGAQIKVEAVQATTYGVNLIRSSDSAESSYRTVPGVAYDNDGLSYMAIESGGNAIVHTMSDGVSIKQIEITGAAGRILAGLTSNLTTSKFAFNSQDLSGFTTSHIIWGVSDSVNYFTLPEGADPVSMTEAEGCAFIFYREYGGGYSLKRVINDGGSWVSTHSYSLTNECSIAYAGSYVYAFARSMSGPVSVYKFNFNDLSLVSLLSFNLGVNGVISGSNHGSASYGDRVIINYGETSSLFNFAIYNPSTNIVDAEYSQSIPGLSRTSPWYPCISSDSGLLGWGQRSIYPNKVSSFVFKFESVSPLSIDLSEITLSEVERSAIIGASDVDVTNLAGSVIGYRVTAAGSIRNALEPLRSTYPFDAYQSGYKIRFRSRGTASVATIPIGNLIADTQLEESREMDSQLPQRVTVQCLDRDRNYDQNEQSEDRLGAESADEQTVSIQVVMTSDQAKQVAEKLLYLAWLERSSYSFKLPPIYSALEPSDVITITSDSASYELRLVSASPDSDGLISCSGVPNNAAIYTSTATADGGQQASVTIPLAGSSVMTLLDIPVVDETVQNSAGFVAAMTGYTGGWSGGGIYSSADDGQTWTDLQGFGDKGTFGYAQTPLTVNAGNLVQAGGSLTVSLLSGSLDSVTEAQMFNGSNVAAYGADGRWEIIRFQNAVLNADGSYTLSTFWRGDKGTEWATGLHQSGDLFVLLNDPDNAFISMSQDSIGQPRTYRAITFGADIDSASDTAMTYTGVNLECLSPCHPSSSRDGSGNLTANWVRRTRVGGAWRDYVDASLGETSEAYEIDVMSGTTVKRTLTSSTQSVIYSAANQVADFGSAQASITLRIYQLSSVVGRGYPLEATF